MASRNIINIVLNLDTAAFNRALSGAVFSIDKFGKKLEQTGQNLTTRLTIPLGLAGAAAVQTFLQFDKLEKGLIVFAGSSEAAAKELDGLKSVVLDTRTTIGFQDAVQGALRLRSIGFEADEAREALRQLGIATTASGKTSEDLGEVVNQLTQIIGRGKVLQQDIRVILDRLPVLSTVFKETFGGVSAEAIRNSTENVGDFAAKLFTAIQQGERFGNVQTSAAKQVETFKESSQLALAVIGKSIFENLRLGEVLEVLSTKINNVVTAYENLNPRVKQAITLIATLAVTIGPLLIAVGALARLLPLLVTGFSAIGGVLGIGLVAAFGFAIVQVQKLADEFDSLDLALSFVEAKVKKVNTIIGGVFKGLFSEIARSNQALIALISKDFAGLAAILAAPGFSLKKLTEDADKVFEDSLKQSVKRINERFLEQKRIQKEAAEFSFEDLAKRLTNTGGTTLEEALLSQANYFKTLNQRQPFPNFAPLPAQGDIGDQLRGVSQQFFPLPASVKSTTAEVEKLNQALTSTQNPAAGLKGRITEILQESVLLGRSVEDQYGAIIGEIESTISSVTEQFGAQSAVLVPLTDILNRYKIGLDGVVASQEKLREVQGVVATAFDSAAAAIERSGTSMKNVFAAVGRAALQAAATIVRAKLIESVAAVVADAFKKFGILGTIVAAGAGAAAGAIFQAAINKISAPKLASGGLAYSETLAVVGDNRNARIDPEVIAPLSKLKNLIGGGEGYIAEARISGDDLLILVDRAERRLNRIR